jgi:TPR repeat protein
MGTRNAAPSSQQDGDSVMGRFEMVGAELALMAERQPNGENLFELGMIYSTGREVVADLIAAHKWFNLAALRGNREAASLRQEVAQEMSPAEIAEAQRAAREWLQTH